MRLTTYYLMGLVADAVRFALLCLAGKRDGRSGVLGAGVTGCSGARFAHSFKHDLGLGLMRAPAGGSSWQILQVLLHDGSAFP